MVCAEDWRALGRALEPSPVRRRPRTRAPAAERTSFGVARYLEESGPMDTDARTGLRERDAAPTGAAAEAGPRWSAPPAARARDLRDHLPALETERQVTDWGRSERVEGLFDRTVYEFFYNYWFRCEVEGIEHVPAEGGALIVSNHSGALPPDAPMIAQAIKREHSRPRPLHITVEHFFKGYPGFSMLVPKLGCVPAHPANVHRLLADEEQLVLVFPEGRKGTVKTYKDRYRLRRFGRGGFVEAAMRARAPIQPVALIGAEEAAPDLRPLQRAREAERVHLLPAHADVPPLRRAGDVRLPPRQVQDPLPAAVPTDDLGEAPWEDAGLVQTMAQDVRDLIQDHVVDMVGKRRSVWFG